VSREPDLALLLGSGRQFQITLQNNLFVVKLKRVKIMNKESAEVPGSQAFRRRLRRHVQARVHRFAAITPPELAPLCRRELESLALTTTAESAAGVEFSGKLSACYQANLWLRCASRVLCRLPSFRAGVPGELLHKAAAVPWELWLDPALPIRMQVHVERSRLHHAGLMEDTVLRAIQQRFRERGHLIPATQTVSPTTGSDAASEWCQRVLARLESNHCTISLDTTGPHLHQRGYRLKHAGAPLRETLAAAILLKAGWQGDRPLVDGMCGAGTVAIEAAMIARRLPPGGYRAFLFERWPSFLDKSWGYLRRKALETAAPRASCPILAIDHDDQALRIAQQNALRARVAEDIRWERIDFFAFRPDATNLSNGLLVLDPPYGRRMTDTGDPLLFYRRLGDHLRQCLAGWQVAVAAPSAELAAALGIKPASCWQIPHGGIPLTVSFAEL
jgi:23S rRNA G2445 N2-methylase RlmL